MDLPFHWRMFMRRYQLPLPSAEAPSESLLAELVSAFSNVPFENATQINRLYDAGPKPRAADVLITEHLLHGTGGICYCLVNALAELLELHGFAPRLHQGFVGEYPGARYTPNHAALTVSLHGRLHLCDPGMILSKPLTLADDGPSVFAEHRESDLLAERNASGHLLVMFRSTHGFSHTFMVDLRPVTRLDFVRSWRRSFDPLIPADYLLVHKLVDRTLWMLRDQELVSRDANGRAIEHSASWREIGDRFGIDAPILERAWHRTKYARPSYRFGRELARAARTTMTVVRSMTEAVREAAAKRAA
jgi:arylamine N-acetyltransferase